MRTLAALISFVILTSCSSVYVPREINDDSSDVAVRVLPVTSSSVLAANRETKYSPRRLPAAFNQTAGFGSGLRGVGAIPETPVQPEVRPAAVQLRPPPPANRGPYRIGVGDVLVLATPAGRGSVEELSGLLAAQNRRQGYTVQDDGSITIPDVGRVQIGNMTLSQAEDSIFKALIDRQIEPTFSVEISSFNSQRVSIGGAVKKPSVIPISLSPLYLNEALAGAGGIDVSDPDFATIRIYRDGQLYQIPMNAYNSNNRWQRIELLDTDSVFVDTEYSLERAEAYFEQQIRVAEIRQSRRASALNELKTEIDVRRAQLSEERSNFESRLKLGAVGRDYVYLSGELGDQIRFPLPFERKATLADAIYEAGGIDTKTGNPSQIYVLRSSTDTLDFAAVTAWHLDGSNVSNMVLATRFELRPNDVVFVAEQPITRWNRVIQQFVPSLIISGVNAATR